MTPLLVSMNKSSELRIGSRKCRLHKKADVVKTAKAYNIPTDGKTIAELCLLIKTKAKAAGNFNNIPLADVYRNRIALAKLYQNKIPLAKMYPGAAKRIAAMEKTQNMNNVPLATMYPGAAKRIAAMKKVSPSRVVVVDKANAPPAASRVAVAIKPRAKPTKNAAIKRIGAMRTLTAGNKMRLQRMIINNAASPARVIRMGREIATLR